VRLATSQRALPALRPDQPPSRRVDEGLLRGLVRLRVRGKG